jgi:L-threonylcarbamoyladenylate synthase
MYATITKDSSKAGEVLRQGRVVAFPTGTSYGLAVDALQGHALQRLRNLKRRPAEKTFTVFIDPELVESFIEVTAEERALLAHLSRQPLTLLVKPKESLAHLAQAGVIGLRVIDHPLMAALAQVARVPLTATSANVAGGAPCFTPACVLQTFPGLLPSDRLDEADPQGARGTTYDLSLGVVLDGGHLPASEPTTIAKLVGEKVEIIRPGKLPETEIANAARKPAAGRPRPAA